MMTTAHGDPLIHPTQEPEDRGSALLRALCGLDAELVQALEASQREDSVAMQDREAL